MNLDFAHMEGSWTERVKRWLTPNGSATMDGARLAAINATILLGLFIAAGVFSVFRALFGWLLPFPTTLFGFIMIVLTFAVFAMVWFRYANAHRSAALQRGGINAGRFGSIAAIPFLVLALMLFGSGLMALFFGLISFSSGRIGSAILRMFYAMLFVMLAFGNYLAARFVAER